MVPSPHSTTIPTKLVIGLTGGIGSGKSTIAQLLREKGFPVVDADEVARDIVKPGTQALLSIAKQFGASVLHGDGTLNRRALGTIVFKDPAALQTLEEITHPAIREASLHALSQHFDAGHSTAFYEAAILLRMGGNTPIVDKVVVVSAELNIRQERVLKRDGYSKEDFLHRVHKQMTDEDMRKQADFVIENNHGIQELKAQLQDLQSHIETWSKEDAQ